VDSVMHVFFISLSLPMDLYRFFVVLWFLFCTFYNIRVHYLVFTKSFTIYNGLFKRKKVSNKEYVEFILLLLNLCDFYFKFLLYMVEPTGTFTVAKSMAVAAKALAKICIYVVNNDCANIHIGTGINACKRAFREELGQGKLYIYTDRAKEIAHRAGLELLKGTTPIGKRLRETDFENNPSKFLNEDIDEDATFNFLKNIEIIHKRIVKIGIVKLRKILWESGVELIFLKLRSQLRPNF
jgi:hypothetical protein